MVITDVLLVCDACGARQSQLIDDADLPQATAKGVRLLCLKCQEETLWRIPTGEVNEGPISTDPLLEEFQTLPASPAAIAVDPLLISGPDHETPPRGPKGREAEYDWFG